MLDSAMQRARVEPPRRPADAELPALERWLDAGLRRGEPGRLAAEYPLSMGPQGSRGHRCAFAGAKPVAHAMSHTVTVVARGRRLPVGMIGNVYTDPAWRGRGLARGCVAAAVADLHQRGSGVALLWSDRRDFYARLGFHPAGRERLWDVSAAAPARPGATAADLRPEDLPALERLYAAKSVRTERPVGALARLLAAPETHVAVAHAADRPLAYAVCGRGDDFQGVIHEWAGAPEAVAACIDRLRRRHGAHSLLAGPDSSDPSRLLARLGASPRDGIFALARILDAERLWRAIGPRRGSASVRGDHRGIQLGDRDARHAIPHERALDLFFGAGPSAAPELPRGLRRGLARALPWPLYVWGLDSI